MGEEAPVPELRVPELQETHMMQEAEDNNDYTYEAPTRHEIETIEEMNSTNAEFTNDAEFTNNNIDTDTAIEYINEVTEKICKVHTEGRNSASHGYNLCPRPAKRHEKLNLLQVT